MTPAEHIKAAETILTAAGDNWENFIPSETVPELLLAIGHALIAIAVESGVPHQTTTPAVG
jgi:hypothetical protein